MQAQLYLDKIGGERVNTNQCRERGERPSHSSTIGGRGGGCRAGRKVGKKS